MKVLEGHVGSVSSVAISVDGSKIVSASWDNTVRVWSMATGKVRASEICCVCLKVDWFVVELSINQLNMK